jgi:hypothetical protein
MAAGGDVGLHAQTGLRAPGRSAAAKPTEVAVGFGLYALTGAEPPPCTGIRGR